MSERERFEAWAREYGYRVSHHGEWPADMCDAWAGWQAALTSAEKCLAAAPELYEALRRLSWWCDLHEELPPQQAETYLADLSRARDALAKVS